MNREERINQKVEEAFNALHEPGRYEGSPFLDARIKAAVKAEYRQESLSILPRLAGVAAVALVLLNVAFFTRSTTDETLTRSEGIDLLLESYTLVPAADWDNYLAQEDGE